LFKLAYSVQRVADIEEKRKEGSQNKFVSHITLGSSFVIGGSETTEAITNRDCRALINQSSQ